jgi:mono/diheme cytochrome c family protein
MPTLVIMKQFILFVCACVLGVSAFFYQQQHRDSALSTAGNSELKSSIYDAKFSIKGPGFQKSFTASELLKSKNLRTIVVEKDPAYGDRKMTYAAVPLNDIFEGINLDAISTMSFKCLDGFSGAISKTRAFNKNPSGSIAYIAIESEDKKWSKLSENKPTTPGPFYLIWDHPEKSKIMTDEWPFQLAGLELSEVPFEDQFPKTQPDTSVSHNDPIRKGYATFMTTCFACHSINGDGGLKIGPDLNIPFSPTEYLQPKFFMTLVRNPQNLRKWEQARMPGFKPADLSDDDLKNIWAYLSHMSTKKN